MYRRKIKYLLSITILALSLFCFTFHVSAAGVTKTATAHYTTDYEWHYNLVKVTHPAVTFQGACFINYNMPIGMRPIVTTNAITNDPLGDGEYGKCMYCGYDNYQYYYNNLNWLDDWEKPCGVTHGYHTCGDFGNSNLVYYSIIIAPECTNCGFSDGLITIPEHDVWYCPTCANDSSAYQSEALLFAEPTSYAYYCHTCNRAIADALADSHEHNLSYAPAHTVTTDSVIDYYYNTQYGYEGDSSSFTVYPVKITYNNLQGETITSAEAGVTATISSPDQTATDYYYPGNTINVNLTSSVLGLKMNGVEIKDTCSFTMPQGDVTLIVIVDTNPVTVEPTVGKTSLTVGEQTQVNPNSTDGSTVTYSSSNASGLEVNSAGGILAKKVGTYTITVKATL